MFKERQILHEITVLKNDLHHVSERIPLHSLPLAERLNRIEQTLSLLLTELDLERVTQPTQVILRKKSAPNRNVPNVSNSK